MKRLVILCMLTLLCVSSVSAEIVEKACTESIPHATHTGILYMSDILQSGMIFCLNTEIRVDVIDGNNWGDSGQRSMLGALVSAQGLVSVGNTTTHTTVSYNDEGHRWEYRWSHYKISGSGGSGGSGGGGGGSVRKLLLLNYFYDFELDSK